MIIVTGQQALHHTSVQSVSGKQSLCFADKRLHREKYEFVMNEFIWELRFLPTEQYLDKAFLGIGLGFFSSRPSSFENN